MQASDDPVKRQETETESGRELEKKACQLKYKAIMLDHDDTAVDSTLTIHWPAYVDAMRKLRPGQATLGFEEWVSRLYSPGLMPFYREECGLNDEEMKEEYDIWRTWTASKMPHFYEGFLEALVEYRQKGGKIFVVSHSDRDVIERHYSTVCREKGMKAEEEGFPFPDKIFAQEKGVDKKLNKPFPYPVLFVKEKFGIDFEEICVVDDLNPGVEMARAASPSVVVAGVLWSHNVPSVREYMSKNADVLLPDVATFRNLILPPPSPVSERPDATSTAESSPIPAVTKTETAVELSGGEEGESSGKANEKQHCLSVGGNEENLKASAEMVGG
uniref:Uncharacterized protein n=1 Tax=Chromera velia CCMP2878 TaxID=1169474 RepID=A0A0G4GDG7_9ALVE|mmetsp:Transcript_7896/g.15375  ORF Transcript_7896/g.15375 Transcript_7896/m.15375 type:complete len:330 (+) Transcript_7896:258-1247(+)|eukprot:Cvel_21400.t1-p1 / transcript=Cvel_21400.t1 / gene=Cvel_21400 / organism=Chromera_velia_CCMP2878 / gene_product=hypothetical protein / transcript_product=hypothetical protein / location=Cvel_scaffold2004:17002-18990(-) / protein_length=329 / sequence_SO=supercontig / SO=protein_coding / is_pseudo=false